MSNDPEKSLASHAWCSVEFSRISSLPNKNLLEEYFEQMLRSNHITNQGWRSIENEIRITMMRKELEQRFADCGFLSEEETENLEW